MGAHEELDATEIPFVRTAVQVVDHPSWCGDDNMRTATQLHGLGHHVHPADNDGRADAQRAAEHRELVCDLERQFSAVKSLFLLRRCDKSLPCGSEDECKDPVWVDGQFLEDGKGEGDGLAGACLCVAYTVIALNDAL